MKKLIILSTSLLLVAATSCIKELPIKPGKPIVVVPIPPKVDTLVVPNGTLYKLLCASTTNINARNDLVVVFSSVYHNAYIPGEDAPDFPGFGALASWTTAPDTTSKHSDVPLAVNAKIYQRNIPTKYIITTRSPDTYTFSITDHVLPVGAHIWLVGKDSVDITTTPYTTFINTSDTLKVYLK